MGGHSPCASCKLLRRRCTVDCIFSPYFPSEEPHKFAIVHKVFGASNISKMLQDIPVYQRADAVNSMVFEANARVRDPVFGCVGAIYFLQNQVSELRTQLAVAQAEILCFQMQPEHVVLPTAPLMAYSDENFSSVIDNSHPQHYNVPLHTSPNIQEYTFKDYTMGDNVLGDFIY